jgi:hypothetical protein
MITYRTLTQGDYELLRDSLAKDIYHQKTRPTFFTEKETVTVVYEDDDGPVLFVRGKPEKTGLRLDIQFVDNEDGKRNIKTMLEGFPPLADRAKNSGFTHIIFDSVSPLLRKFCLKRLNFLEGTGQNLIRVLE